MQNQIVSKTRNLVTGIWYLVISAFVLLAGCTHWDVRLAPEGSPTDEQICQSFQAIELKVSDAADVLATIARPTSQMISQSNGIIASAGQKKKGYKSWFNMVAFDENELTVRRKYLFILDERPDIWEQSRKDLRFDCQMVLEGEVLEGPRKAGTQQSYENENARRIAILQQVRQNTSRDISEVSPDNKTIEISGMLIDQVMAAILLKLDKSPILAARLTDRAGVEFDHINLDKGSVQMLVEGDIVTVKIRTGKLAEEMLKPKK